MQNYLHHTVPLRTMHHLSLGMHKALANHAHGTEIDVTNHDSGLDGVNCERASIR